MSNTLIKETQAAIERLMRWCDFVSYDNRKGAAMTNLMFLLLYCIGVAVLFMLACVLEKLALWWHETHRRSQQPPYHMRDYRRSK